MERLRCGEKPSNRVAEKKLNDRGNRDGMRGETWILDKLMLDPLARQEVVIEGFSASFPW